MNNLKTYIASIIIALLIGRLSQYLEPKAKVYNWYPGTFIYILREPAAIITTPSMTIQNGGRKAAENMVVGR
jgi:hypothetical protein